ncbi:MULTISPECIES: antibiotic biosynthesis monooxygenase [Rhodomicrobium]|uniref:putative quinol monooxygenase n=1 Tax=Rhodomicrobium TaxID=1068 RepID=UPI000B4B5B1C|nr:MULTISPECIES: antibiotic biosynthesis monooxygenase [Rhodomicrobium]
MVRRAPMKSARGATATGAQATGTAALGSLALGAMALGAMAVGALAIGRLSVGRARLRRVEIGELVVGRLDIAASGPQAGTLTAVTRIRAAPGKGDAMAELLRDHLPPGSPDWPGLLSGPPQRSTGDPDRFVLYQQCPDEAAFEHYAHARLDVLRRQIAEQGLAADSGADAVEVELYRTI